MKPRKQRYINSIILGINHQSNIQRHINNHITWSLFIYPKHSLEFCLYPTCFCSDFDTSNKQYPSRFLILIFFISFGTNIAILLNCKGVLSLILLDILWCLDYHYARVHNYIRDPKNHPCLLPTFLSYFFIYFTSLIIPTSFWISCYLYLWNFKI